MQQSVDDGTSHDLVTEAFTMPSLVFVLCVPRVPGATGSARR